ncbi:hypothetical protein S678_004425 [Salmonella enterica subsp. enterica]|nr:hypothetical protein [Salmonella enterica subsp. enterica]
MDNGIFIGGDEQNSYRLYDYAEKHYAGLFAGTAEISVPQNFGVQRSVRKTVVNRTSKK